ncbi:histidine kinase [Chitinophaga sp. NPDC101104]|uniref:histidine kinase n=1 Tax=Chitinophaga sp. NPDC101104 TaxID=3390561 RepID=UPI003CFCC1CB
MRRLVTGLLLMIISGCTLLEDDDPGLDKFEKAALEAEEVKYSELLGSMTRETYALGGSDYWFSFQNLDLARIDRDSARLLLEKAKVLARRSESVVQEYFIKSMNAGYQRERGLNWELQVRNSGRSLSKLIVSNANNFIPIYATAPAISYLADKIGEGENIRRMIGLSEGDLDQDLKSYAPAQRISALGQLGAIRMRQGKFREAKKLYVKALNESGREGKRLPDLLFMMGVALLRTGSSGEALRYVDSAIQVGKSTSNWQLISEAYTFRHRELFSQLPRRQMHDLDSALYYHLRADSMMLSVKVGEILGQLAVKEKNIRIKRILEKAQDREQINGQRKLTILYLSLLAVSLCVIAVLVYRRYRMRLQIREGELLQQLFRSQMEGHFMYNSLANLQGMVRNRDHDNALQYLGTFSRLLQLNQFNSRSSFVSLRDEVTALETYLQLQQVHLAREFTYKIDLYEGFGRDGVQIPPMLVQPFVENAVVHGVSRLEGNGMIRISFTKGIQTIHCRIEDNGPGLDAPKPLSLKPSLSTQITNKRLRVLGKRIHVVGRLEVRSLSEPGRTGTVVLLDIPYRVAAVPANPNGVPAGDD